MQDFLNKIPAKYHAIIYAIISIFCVYIAGEASKIIAFFANDKGINFPIREVINLALILVFAKIFFAKNNDLISPKDFNFIAIIIGAFCASFIVFGSWAIALFTKTISIAPKSNFANITLLSVSYTHLDVYKRQAVQPGVNTFGKKYKTNGPFFSFS